MNFLILFLMQSSLLWSFGKCQWGSPQCGQIIRTKRSILEQPANIPETCIYTIQAFNDHVCQLLIQFQRFTLQQPTLQGNLLTCEDRFDVDDFSLCGDNTGQHLYVSFPITSIQNRRQITLNFNLPNHWSGSKWRLVITQLECPHSMDIFRLSRLPGFGFLQNIEDTTRNMFPPPTFGDLEQLAPTGCHQYYTQSTGIIKSFNFNITSGALYMPKTKYAICIKSQMGARKIEYNFRQFSMVTSNSNQIGYDIDCRSMVATAGRSADFLMIPQASITNLPMVTPTYFCGRSLLGHQVSATSPFIIYFESDDIADPIETGFSIDYMVKSA